MATAATSSAKPATTPVSDTCAQSPIRHVPMARPSASFKPSCENAPTPAPSTRHRNEQTRCRGGRTPTTSIGRTPHSPASPKSLDDVNGIISDVVTTGHRNGTRISIALGGATDYGFLNLMTSVGNNPDNPLLDRAVQNVVKFVTSNNLDGVVDLECWWGKFGEKDQGG